MATQTSGWPMYFLARAPRVAGRRLVGLTAGDAWPWQDKRIIRGFGASFGVGDAMDRAWADLDYVATINVDNEDMRRSIIERGMNLQAAQRMLGQSAPTGKARASARAEAA